MTISAQLDRQKLEQWAAAQCLLRDPNADPVAVAQEQGWLCPFCGGLMLPATFMPDPWRRPGRGLWLAPTHHGCQQERGVLDQAARAEAVARDAARRVRWTGLLEYAGLVGRLGESTFDTFLARADWSDAQTAQARARAWWLNALDGKGAKPWLVLVGNVGTGKSHLAAACVRAALEAGKRSYFRVWGDYLKRLQLSWGGGDEREADIIEELADGWLVAIDDLDKRRGTEWGREMLFSVINSRYNNRLPTVLTLNTALTELDAVAPGRLALESLLGAATLDRIFELATVVEFDGPSYR
jgi:DNA replication protein DnaC